MKFFIISRKIKTYTLQRYYHITFYIYKIKFLYLYHLYKPATYFCTILPFSFPFFSPKNIYFIFFHIRENKTTFFFAFILQDLQSEIETHRVVYDRLDGTGRKLLGSLTSQEDAVMLQRRLDEMNQRWNNLKSKSIAIR